VQIPAAIRRLSLRARLTLLSVLLVAVGLVAAGIATRYELQSFLVDRVDQQAASAVVPALEAMTNNRPQQLGYAVPPRSFAALVGPDGSVSPTSVFVGKADEEPGDLAALASAAPAGNSSAGGYRLHSVAAPLRPGTRLVIGIPLSDVNSTLNRLTALELLVGVIVIAVVGGFAYALVRLELRPLRRIEDTAAAIAAGDLTQRVEQAEPTTEVGRLGASLNAMLAQIERAFNEREASQERLRRFVADASHELRTPLTSVRGYAELFRRGAAERPEDLAVVMSRIEAEAARMGVLVDDLLLLARLDQGRPLERRPVDLTHTVEELVEDHRLLYPDRPIHVRSESGVTVVGDQLRLRQAIGNLLSNARSHTPSGTPVAVSLARDDGTAVVEVADQGPGIPPDHAARVFERFFRADPSRTRGSGGAGLGLSIVAAIAEAHGGHAELAETSEHGSRFRIVLPVAAANGGEDGQPAGFDQPVDHDPAS
jgi:two-component system, OmpR family, sensor kinase